MTENLDHEALFRAFCERQRLTLRLSFDMPEGFETANGSFDPVTQTVFFNRALLREAPAYEQLFYLFHELRHASQYLQSERFDALIARSLRYVIQYDGVCFKRDDGVWKSCRLEGSEAYFRDLYLAQPNERDANAFACETVKQLLGDSRELRKLLAFWTPQEAIPDEAFEKLYAAIDAAVDGL